MNGAERWDKTTDLLHHVEAEEVGAAGRVGRDEDVADEADQGGQRGEAREGLPAELFFEARPLWDRVLSDQLGVWGKREGRVLGRGQDGLTIVNACILQGMYARPVVPPNRQSNQAYAIARTEISALKASAKSAAEGGAGGVGAFLLAPPRPRSPPPCKTFPSLGRDAQSPGCCSWYCRVRCRGRDPIVGRTMAATGTGVVVGLRAGRGGRTKAVATSSTPNPSRHRSRATCRMARLGASILSCAGAYDAYDAGGWGAGGARHMVLDALGTASPLAASGRGGSPRERLPRTQAGVAKGRAAA